MLSMASSDDMDEELLSSQNTSGQNISFSSSKYSSQDNSKQSITTDEVDLDMSLQTVVSSRLSHSAARHKMAVRPKKKGPTRHHRHRPIEVC